MVEDRPIQFQGVRALVVEDEVLIAVALEEALIDLGIEVVGPFPSLQQARAVLDREPVAVAVLDVNVRGEMVFPLAAELKQRGVPLVFCTGYADLNLVPQEFHASPCLGKPCMGDSLAEALTSALSQAACASESGKRISASRPDSSNAS